VKLGDSWKSTKRKETANEIVGSEIEEFAMNRGMRNEGRFEIRELSLEVCDEG
jgi:hypothetical protein